MRDTESESAATEKSEVELASEEVKQEIDVEKDPEQERGRKKDG